jgi:hypothetical protein
MVDFAIVSVRRETPVAEAVSHAPTIPTASIHSGAPHWLEAPHGP